MSAAPSNNKLTPEGTRAEHDLVTRAMGARDRAETSSNLHPPSRLIQAMVSLPEGEPECGRLSTSHRSQQSRYRQTRHRKRFEIGPAVDPPSRVIKVRHPVATAESPQEAQGRSAASPERESRVGGPTRRAPAANGEARQKGHQPGRASRIGESNPVDRSPGTNLRMPPARRPRPHRRNRPDHRADGSLRGIPVCRVDWESTWRIIRRAQPG